MPPSEIPLTERTFVYQDLALRVRSSGSSHLAWLDEFITPPFQCPDAPPAARTTVTLRENTEAYEAVRREGPAPGAPLVDAFALDSHVIRLPLWTSPDGRRVLFDEKFSVFYCIGPDASAVELLSPAPGRRARVPLMRVLREFAMNYTLRRGALFIHGSAFSIAGNGVLVAGPKHAGKTTLLTHALQHPDARYLSNDRVLVSYDGPAPRLRGMPTIATIRLPMLELMPVIKERLAGATYHHHFTLAESRERTRLLRPWDNGKIGLSPAQFCTMLGTSPVAEADARVLLLPAITGAPGGFSLRQLPAEEAAARLSDALFGATCWKHDAEVFDLPDAGPYPDRAALHARCRRFTTQVRCLECALGTEAYDASDPGLLVDQLMDQVC